VSTPNGDITVTNEGATILKSIIVDNPAAKVLVNISMTQDDEVGDGTTSVTVLAGELLREAEKLIQQRIHPMVIIDGWRRASQVARAALEASALDHSADPVAFRQDLLNIARTTLSSKLLTHEKGQFADLAVAAIMRIKGTLNLEAIQILKKSGGSLKDSYLEEGFILNKKIGVGQPVRVENARILLANTAMDTDKVKIFGTRVKVDSMAKIAEIEAAEKDKMRAKVAKITGHGINVFINRQLIYNFPEQLFAEGGVMAIEHADFDGIERLAAVTGGEIVSTFDHPELVRLGEAKLIEEVMIGEVRGGEGRGWRVGRVRIVAPHQLTPLYIPPPPPHPPGPYDSLQRRQGGRGLHHCAARLQLAPAGRGGALPARRAVRAHRDDQGEQHRVWRRLLRVPHGQRRGRGGAQDARQAPAGHGGVRARAAPAAHHHRRQCGLRLGGAHLQGARGARGGRHPRGHRRAVGHGG
jgi:hypothetical protein